jgi:amino acid transporter
VDPGIKNSRPRLRKFGLGDAVARLIVGLLFAASAVGVFVLTGSVFSALFVGVLVGLVATGVVAML